MEYVQAIALIAFGFILGYWCVPVILKWFGLAHIFVDKQYSELKEQIEFLHEKIDELINKVK